MAPITYEQAGVDTTKAANLLTQFAQYVKSRPTDPRLVSGLGGFAAAFDLTDLKAFTRPLMVTCCDGVGTKLMLGLAWNQTEDLGQDLVAMNVNDLICVGAEPAVFLDYFACGKLEGDTLLGVLKSVHRACELTDCTLAGGETAEMPGMYPPGEWDLAGFAVGFVDEPKRLGPHRVQEGDALVGIASSGPHSNGYSLIRKILEAHPVEPDAETPFGGTWRQHLMAPTALYPRAVRGVRHQLHALAHITGGGLFENLPRILPDGLQARVLSDKWPRAPLFEWLAEKAELDWRQLLHTFNGGVGLIAVIAPSELQAVQAHFNKQGLETWHLGEIEKGTAGVNWT